MAKFENILDTIGRTPVVRINKLAPKGVNLYVKVGWATMSSSAQPTATVEAGRLGKIVDKFSVVAVSKERY